MDVVIKYYSYNVHKYIHIKSMFFCIDFKASAMYRRSATSYNSRKIGRLSRQTLLELKKTTIGQKSLCTKALTEFFLNCKNYVRTILTGFLQKTAHYFLKTYRKIKIFCEDYSLVSKTEFIVVID